MLNIDAIRDAVAQVAPAYPILRVDLFGSYADGKAGSASDVDVLIQKRRPFSLLQMCEFGQRLEELLGVKVDIVIENQQGNPELLIDRKVPLYEQR